MLPETCEDGNRMNKTEYMVYWTGNSGCAEGSRFADMSKALAFMQMLRANPNNKFISMASESVENVGKLGVDTVVDGKCPDGGDFLGRLSRHGMMLKRGR